MLVVSPALNSPLRHLVSDEDGARGGAGAARAQPRRGCSEEGIEAAGEVGDGDPLQAIEDALRTFGADEIIISTHPEGRSHWLERGVVDAGARALRGADHHVVVDLERARVLAA